MTPSLQVINHHGRGSTLPVEPVPLDAFQRQAEDALKSGDISRARSAASVALSRYRSSLWATRLLAEVLAREGNRGQALVQYRLAASVDPLDGQLYRAMIELANGEEVSRLQILLDDHWSGSLGPLRRMPSIVGTSRLAIIQTRSGLWYQAADSLRRAIVRDGSRIDLYLLLARCFYMIRAFEQAHEVISVLLRAASDCLEGNVIACLLARRIGRIQESDAFRDRAYACDPTGLAISRLLVAANLPGSIRRSVDILPEPPRSAFLLSEEAVRLSGLSSTPGNGTDAGEGRTGEGSIREASDALGAPRSIDGSSSEIPEAAVRSSFPVDQPSDDEKVAASEEVPPLEAYASPTSWTAIQPEPTEWTPVTAAQPINEPEQASAPSESGHASIPRQPEDVASERSVGPAGTSVDQSLDSSLPVEPVVEETANDDFEQDVWKGPGGQAAVTPSDVHGRSIDTNPVDAGFESAGSELSSERADHPVPADEDFPDFEAWFQASVMNPSAINTEERPDVPDHVARKAGNEATPGRDRSEDSAIRPDSTLPTRSVEAGPVPQPVDDEAGVFNGESHLQDPESGVTITREDENRTDKPRRWSLAGLGRRDKPIKSKLADLADTVVREPLNNGARFELAQELERADPSQAVAQYASIVASRDPRLVSDVRLRLEGLLEEGNKVHGLQRLLGDVCMQQGAFERAIECYSLAFDELRSHQLSDSLMHT